MQIFVDLVGVIIWPLTILIILYWFRSQFSSAFSRVKDFQASATGLSMSFSEQLEATKKMAQTIKNGGISKSAKLPSLNNPNPHLEKLAKVSQDVKIYLEEVAKKSSIDVQGKSISSLNDLLKEKGIIRFNKFKLIESFVSLTDSANSTISAKQVEDIEEISKIIIT